MGPTNQIDWGQLLGMYQQAANQAQPELMAKQAAERAQQQQAINGLMGGIEKNVYANVGNGVAGQATSAPGYSQLVDAFNANEAKKYASNVEGAAWETMLKNPNQLAAGAQTKDPFDNIKQTLDSMQANANQQAQWNLGQKQWQADQQQRARAADDMGAGNNFRKAWDAWLAKGGGAGSGKGNAQLTAEMEKSQADWRAKHGGSLDGWYTQTNKPWEEWKTMGGADASQWFNDAPVTNYAQMIGGYSPQAYTPHSGGYAGGFGGGGSYNPNSTNQSTAKPDDETSY